MAAFNKITYTPNTPAQEESERLTFARKPRSAPARTESNGAVGSAIAGQKLSGGANVNGGSV